MSEGYEWYYKRERAIKDNLFLLKVGLGWVDGKCNVWEGECTTRNGMAWNGECVEVMMGIVIRGRKAPRYGYRIGRY